MYQCMFLDEYAPGDVARNEAIYADMRRLVHDVLVPQLQREVPEFRLYTLVLPADALEATGLFPLMDCCTPEDFGPLFKRIPQELIVRDPVLVMLSQLCKARGRLYDALKARMPALKARLQTGIQSDKLM